MQTSSDDTTEDFLIRTICTACGQGRAQVDLNTSLLDIAFDSMALTTLIVAVEAAFECEIAQEHLPGLFESVRVADLVGRIRDAVNAST